MDVKGAKSLSERLAVKRPCSVCGQESAEWQRNTDGTYLHEGCAATVAPIPVLASREPEEEADGA